MHFRPERLFAPSYLSSAAKGGSIRFDLTSSVEVNSACGNFSLHYEFDTLLCAARLRSRQEILFASFFQLYSPSARYIGCASDIVKQ